MLGRRNRFSLVELLVVIAVIAILSGLLLPALAKARDKAKQIQCLGNLKQMGVGMAIYTSDNDYMMPRYYLRADGSPVHWVYDLLPPCLGVNSKYGIGRITASGRDPFACPSVSVTDAAAYEDGCSIGYNAFLMNYTDQYKGPRFVAPYRHCLLADASGDKISNVIPAGIDCEIRLRHGGAANVLYADLHVNSRQKGTFSLTGSATSFWRAAGAYTDFSD